VRSAIADDPLAIALRDREHSAERTAECRVYLEAAATILADVIVVAAGRRPKRNDPRGASGRGRPLLLYQRLNRPWGHFRSA